MSKTWAAPDMDAEILIVQVCEFLDNGDGHYRFHQPARALSRLPGACVVECPLEHHLLPGLLAAADVLLLQDFHWDLFPLIERRRAEGRVTLQEANDDYFDLQPWNTRAAMWQNRSTQDLLRQCLAAVDAVQTSTEVLARRWRTWARSVAVFANQLTAVPPLVDPPSRPLTVGWAGSIGHLADWYHVAPLLQRWFEAHPDVHLHVMSGEAARPFVRLPPERYHFRPGGSLADYLHFLGRLDVGLAPLLPSDYNCGRSDVKFLEYAACGVAGVYADLEPYQGSVKDGETGLLYRSGPELLACLDRLADDAALRRAIRQRAHAHVAAHRLIDLHVGERLDFYRSRLPGPPRGFELPPEVVAAATVDGRHLQLRPGPPEGTLHTALQAPPAEGVKQLARLLQRYPIYQAALLHQGRLLNDLRRHGEALAFLERARGLNPLSAEALSEMGRARAGRGELDEARRSLEQAVTLNPYHQRAWQYLLQLLGRSPGSEAASWAERAHRLHPANIHLALLGVRLYAGREAVAAMQRLLDAYAPTLRDEERPAAATAFAAAIGETLQSASSSPGVAALLERACAVFPASADLAGQLGQALYRAGRAAEGRAHLARASELRRSAHLAADEGTPDEGSLLYMQLAEHIERVLALGSPGADGQG
jgi:tetratricopeptide (TPR) repeat protein